MDTPYHAGWLPLQSFIELHQSLASARVVRVAQLFDVHTCAVWYKCVSSLRAKKMRHVKGGSKKIRRKILSTGMGRWAKRLFVVGNVVGGGWAIKRKGEDIFSCDKHLPSGYVLKLNCST